MSEPQRPASDPGGPGLPKLDPIMHSQPRLRVVVTLATLAEGDRLSFPRLQDLVAMTAGNLSTHLRKLEEAKYVSVAKTYRHRTPVTYIQLTRAGRRAFEDYTSALHELLAMVHDHREKEKP